MACVTPPGNPPRLLTGCAAADAITTFVDSPFLAVIAAGKGLKVKLHYAMPAWESEAQVLSRTGGGVSVNSVLLCASAGRLRRHQARVARAATEVLWERAVSCACLSHLTTGGTSPKHAA